MTPHPLSQDELDRLRYVIERGTPLLTITALSLIDELASLRSMLGRATEALNHYADEANWGNGGWEGHPNDFFNPSRLKADRAWVVAKQVLSEIRGVSGEQTSYRA